jgi:hypothetical protein
MEKYGMIFGVIPYDFRIPTWSREKMRMWNPDDERIIMPRGFGIGWTLNLYQLRKRYPPLFNLLIVAVVVRFAWGAYRFFNKGEEE